MIIYPAIDLRRGNCVRLIHGDFDKETYYSNDPVKIACYYASMGAKFLHVVDLDGAKAGYPIQHDLIFQIQRKSRLNIQVGGGIRDKAAIEQLLKHNISRVILGSIAVNQPSLVKKWLNEFGKDKIILAFDIKINAQGNPAIATQGWQTLSNKILWDLLDEYAPLVKHVLCTDISRDGTLQGPNQSLYQICSLHYPDINFQASGGVQSVEDLKILKKIPIDGVVIGKALYEKKFSLKEAIDEVEKC